MQAKDHSIEGQISPGSAQEYEALREIDRLRELDRRTYEGKRKSGWDARAGSPAGRRVYRIEEEWT